MFEHIVQMFGRVNLLIGSFSFLNIAGWNDKS